MEKYSEFNDPVTGANPYTREIKKKYKSKDLFLTPVLFLVLFSLPSLVLKMIFRKLVLPLAVPREIQKMVQLKKKVFFCTYTSLFDTHVLFRIFKSPRIFLVTEREIFSVSEYNVHTCSSEKEINSAKASDSPVILFLSGGITNLKALLNVEKDMQHYKADGCIAIKYKPSLEYDIDLFGKLIFPQFCNTIQSFIYYLFYYLTLKSKPTASIYFSTSLSGLSTKTRIDVSKETDKKTTRKFLSVFYRK